MRSPYCRIRGGSPAMKCRSEPRFSSTSSRKVSIVATRARISGSRGGRGWRGNLDDLGQHAGVGDVLLERTLVERVRVSVVGIDLARGDRREQGLIEQLHPEIASHLQLTWNLVG